MLAPLRNFLWFIPFLVFEFSWTSYLLTHSGKKWYFSLVPYEFICFSDMDHLLAHCRHYSTILPDNTIWAEYTCASVCHCQCPIWVCGIMAAWHFRTETKCNYLSTFLWSRFTVNFTEKRLISWLGVFFYRSKCRKYKPLTCFI